MPALLGVGMLLPDGLRRLDALVNLPDSRAGVVDGPELGPWLKRKKDARLLPRAAQLALPAAGVALKTFHGDAENLAIFVAVGREPPDQGEAEASLAAMERHGKVALDRLGGDGKALYPPLLPLRTLPNMVLAHVAIQHGIRGENAVFAGGEEAGRHALRAAVNTLVEGRATHALVGAAYSAVDLASARDRLRLGLIGPPGEGAIFLLIGEGKSGEFPSFDALTAGADASSRLAGDFWGNVWGDLGPVHGLLRGWIAQRATLAPHG